MNVLFLTSAFPSFDYPKRNAHNFRSVSQLSEKVQQMQVVHLRSWKPWRKIWHEYQFEGISVWSFSFPYFPYLPSFIVGLNNVIYKKVLYYVFLKRRMQDYDIIHTAGVSMESIVGSYVSKKSIKKHLAQCMGSDVNTVLPIVKDYYGWKGFVSNVNIFVCNSQALQKSVNTMFPNTKSKTIYRGVDLNEFTYKARSTVNSISYKPVTFLYLGGFVTDGINEKYNSKGGVTLLRAWKKIISECTTNCGSIKLIFGGPYVEVKTVNSIIQADYKGYKIEIVGEVSPEEVKNLMEISSVIIIPSFAEGLPNVAMEAAATGRPVIGSSVGGLPEIVIHNETGLLFQPGNEQELSDCIIKYIKNADLIVKHGERARKHVENHFDSSSFCEQYIELYRSLMDQ